LAELDLPQLLDAGPPTAIVITNANHERDTDHWRRLLSVPAWISPLAQVTLPNLHRFPPGPGAWHGWDLQPLQGGAPGEIAFRQPTLHLAILGDAIVNLPDRGLEMLPAKYGTDPSRLANDLLQWCAVPFDRLLVAHGNPVAPHASEHIRQIAAIEGGPNVR
jgi:hypothetical protein